MSSKEEIKGSAVKALKEIVQNKFPSQLNDWLDSLSNTSGNIMKSNILSGKWYPLREAFIEPIKIFCEIFYDNKKEMAWEIGAFVAEKHLKGIYGIFIRFGSPNFVIGRGRPIFSTYFRPAELKLIENTNNKGIVHINNFSEPDEILEQVIGGWIEHALKLSGCKQLEVRITKSLTKGDPVAEYLMTWE